MPVPPGADGWQLEPRGEGRYVLAGNLGLGSAAAVLASGRAAFSGQPRVEVDLSRVERADSAGLAVLIEWTRQARRDGTEISFRALPDKLLGLARIGGVERILPLAS